MKGPFNYNLTDNEIQVKLGNMLVRRLPYYDIEKIQKGFKIWNEHWNNPWPMEFLTIRRKEGIFKNFVINPPNRREFMEELSKKSGVEFNIEHKKPEDTTRH